ncbi:GntR family transcriptional regulator [Dyadobacter fermentans]|uniref:Transcriptional regulator, GntR family n=1 Tax=Dyadobacter fermentans (strain ATCC 700827 / DSM 18053 / CIP 107007 / KCTC 52180 / NS114) TaxID=471854 RepID=C6VTC7_DYAFD|nr:GntR family transcriptional regulator [Dyadobacter fermentans]ACT96491.1 transcriptional regulator, GntR family [Dyadobacter fermentans DSM 18053]
MRKINFENHFTVDRDSSEPVYQQLVEAVLYATKTGLMDRGDRLPSINELSRLYAVSRSTIEKSYNNLRDMGILASQHGKSYYINRLDPSPELKVLVLFNQLDAYNKEIYDAIGDSLGQRAEIDFQIYYNSAAHLKHLLRKKLAGCTHVVIIPHFLDDPVAGAQSIGRIPAQKLILLDADMPNLAENPGLVRENVTKDMPLALAELLPALRKYERISLVGGDDASCEPIRDAFSSFCEANNLTWRLIPGTEEAIPTAGEAFFVLSDEALMRLVGQINQSDLEPGRDVGMVAYRENDAKKTMLNGITTISPDFKAAGKAVADMVSTGHLQQIDNPFRVCVRASL